MSAPLPSPVRQVAVVVPARNERQLLAGCLAALAAAAERVPVPVAIFVVLDRCTDGTAEMLARRPGVRSVDSAAGGVGAARATGAAHALADTGAPPNRTWLACTDADSQVPPSWLAHHLDLADRGADLVLGTVDLAPAEDDGDHVGGWRAAYLRLLGPGGRHPHVHGANLGVRGSSYLAVGGFLPVPAHEDRLLAQAVTELPGAQVVTTTAHPVLTSARLVARAPLGVGADLRALAGMCRSPMAALAE
jgi:glycosyltransferase involved in cell wall biosynthesis